MPDTIRDGTGKGYLAEIDSKNRMRVRATTQNELGYISEEEQKGFSVYGKRNFAAASTNENILSMTYNGTGGLHIQKIVFSSNSSDAKIEVYFDATSISGGTSVLPLNLNRGSAKTSETTCLNGNTTLSGTVSAELEMFDVRLNKSTFEMDFGGGVILTKGKNLIILGEVGAIGDKCRVMVYYYEVA